MKVGIVTFTFGDNYGQRLQNYAVQELLQRRGADASTIRQSEPRCSLKHQVKVFLSIASLVRGGAKRSEAFSVSSDSMRNILNMSRIILCRISRRENLMVSTLL